MPAKPLDEHAHVRACLSALCREAGFADPGALVQRDLLFLCDLIETRTGTIISLSTLKRLLAGQFVRLPQVATLDALAQTTGYAHWQAYRAAAIPTPAPATRRRAPRLRWIALGASLCLLALVSLALVRTRRHAVAGAATASFSATKVTGNDLPNTVVFHYNIDGVTADSFFIQQSWDRHRRVRIQKGVHTLTDLYLEPGYHVAKLIANDEIIKTIDVSIPTDRWVYYAQPTFGGEPTYITPATPLALTRADLTGVDPQKEHLYVMANFPTARPLSSDSFTLRFRARVTEPMGNLCPFIMGEVFCQRNFMYFATTPPGCSSASEVQFGENFMGGKTHDLSALGSDVRNWRHIALSVRNRQATIAIDGRPVMTTTYHQSCGQITGLGFISNGLCQVDSIALQ
ncbi:MAG TPA: hypothetical protein VL547_02290 [Dinghuibacter sp.]|uniref:hypothetical protein n=1 Tax=Dinghuibacter sp. TaxID=2024697 RepID=UPI002CD66ED0|nr:hypothetical protein [Dinghuibacter sp.]HTJ10821.1 hypothetical protein [Dinghuibacter sp.]